MPSVESLSPSEEGHGSPFMVRLFHRPGSFHRLQDFSARSLPPHESVYLGRDCTLDELALEIAASQPSALPSPAIGTRLMFQLVFPDLRSSAGNATGSQPRFAVRDLGSVVIGAGGPGAELTEDETAAAIREGQKTLADGKFVVGDYISCAILPPLSDGSVAPASLVKRESAMPHVRNSRGGATWNNAPKDGGLGRDFSRGGRHNWRDRDPERLPSGDWRRGQMLPEDAGSRRWGYR